MQQTAMLRERAFPTAIIVGAWLLLALAFTPPTALVDRPSALSFRLLDSRTFLFLAVGFLPWMAATPFLLRLARLRPISWRHPSSLLIHLACGLIVIPAATVGGRLLTQLLLGIGIANPVQFVTAVTISGFYSVPTYVAVAAIGQGLALRNRRAPEPLAHSPLEPELASNHLKRIAVRDKGRTELIDTRDIDQIQVAGHYLCIHVDDAVHVTRGQLSALERRLDPAEFVRINRSALIRLDRVRAIQERRNGDCDLILAKGQRLVLSRIYRDALCSRLGVSDL